MQMIIGLLVAIILLIVLILKTKVPPFLALIIAAVTVGLIGGMPPTDIPGSITTGFGGTLGSIGIIIGFGVMMGQIFEKTGAAERMALTFIKLFGKKNEHWAMALTGFIVSIPIFCDSGFVILSPIAKAISKKTRRSIIEIGVPLAAGLVITHALVPPTPGPLGVAGTFGVDVGQFILWGLIISLPMTLVSCLYAQRLGKKIYQLPSDDGDSWIRPEKHEEYSELNLEPSKNLPSTLTAFLPLLVPVLLILVNTVSSALGLEGGAATVVKFLGTPVIAVGLGLLIAIYTLANAVPREDVLKEMSKGLASAGMIIFVTGAGGSLGQILKDSGTGAFIAEQLAAASIPIILLPFIISTLVRFVQGSGTVAMVTAAGICAPIVHAAGASPLLGAFACCIGACFFSYFNDSYFWVVNNLMGITETKEQIQVWSITSTIAWAVGFVMLLILNLFLH
ncbi:MAG: hypothetical protein IKE51_03560 [Solobacterium sp.]|nr:hypothetical protein [Solobacterium sp.]